MDLQQYKFFPFRDSSLETIDLANKVIDEFMQQGFRLTLRQLYYQFVARDLFKIRYRLKGKKWVRDPNGTINAEPNYDALGSLVNNARLAGLMRWDAIEDRTRAFVRQTRWESGKHILRASHEGFHMDMWSNQPCRVFCIVEKEALVGVLERVCTAADVPLLAARGYPSASVLREFAIEDILPTLGPQHVAIIHLGDHDPSGIDMTRDLQDRIRMFCNDEPVELVRVALNMEQINERKPPPNPAKTTDSRFMEYRRQFGDESWELDALPPSYLAKIVADKIDEYRNAELWAQREREVELIRRRLNKIANRCQF